MDIGNLLLNPDKSKTPDSVGNLRMYTEYNSGRHFILSRKYPMLSTISAIFRSLPIQREVQRTLLCIAVALARYWHELETMQNPAIGK